MRSHALVLAAALLLGCGGTPTASRTPAPAAPTSAAPAASSAPAPAASAEEAAGVPTACARGTSKPCLMPRAFVQRLCANAYPDLALLLFQKGTPWSRAYVAVRQAEPFNGLGGPSSDTKLLFDEELIVLSERKPNLGGMTVSGAGASYDLLRWDGTCATLSAEEVRLQRPPKPGYAAITWRYLEDPTQNALLEDERVAKAATDRRRECKGVTVGAVSAKCEKASRELDQRVVEAIRGGRGIPKPAKAP